MAISKVVSIEITDESTKVCEVSYNKKTPIVYQSLMFMNPNRAIEDSFIIEKKNYISELKLQLKNAGIKTKEVVFVLASNKILSREVTIPEMKEKLIPEYIEGEKNEYFPMEIKDHKLSYCIIDQNKDKKEIRIMVYAAPSNLIMNYLAVAKEADLKVVALDYYGNSEYQWLHNNIGSGIEFYLEINEYNTMLTILDKGKFALQRNMNFGAMSLVQALIDEGYYGDLNSDQSMAKLKMESLLYSSFSEIQDFVPQDEEEFNKHECMKHLTESVRPLIDRKSVV